jgi:N-acetylglucosamine malate deacetylase 1
MRSDLPLVVLLPHPDDEFAVLPFLGEAASAGRDIRLVWLTDGGAGRASPAVRKEESLSVLAASGIRGAMCRFLGMDEGLPDGELHRHLRRAKRALDGVVMGIPGPFELWLPAWEGGHQDHDATHALGRMVARQRDAEAWQYPVYRSGDRWGWTFTVLSPLPSMPLGRVVRLPIRDALALIRRCFGYRSQWRSFMGLLPLVAVRLLLLRRPMVMGPVDPTAPLERPHPGVLLYERRSACAWTDLRAAVSEFRPA